MPRVQWTGANCQLSVSFWMKPEKETDTHHKSQVPFLRLKNYNHQDQMWLGKRGQQRAGKKEGSQYDNEPFWIYLPLFVILSFNLFPCSLSSLTTQQCGERKRDQKWPSKTLSHHLFRLKCEAVTKCWHHFSYWSLALVCPTVMSILSSKICISPNHYSNPWTQNHNMLMANKVFDNHNSTQI